MNEQQPEYITLIEYVDSNMQQGQDDGIIKPQVICACGYLLKETEDYTTIALEMMKTSLGYEFRNQVSIPKCAINKQRTIKFL